MDGEKLSTKPNRAQSSFNILTVGGAGSEEILRLDCLSFMYGSPPGTKPFLLPEDFEIGSILKQVVYHNRIRMAAELCLDSWVTSSAGLAYTGLNF